MKLDHPFEVGDFVKNRCGAMLLLFRSVRTFTGSQQPHVVLVNGQSHLIVSQSLVGVSSRFPYLASDVMNSGWKGR